MITDVFRHKHPDTRKFTFSNNSLDLVSKVGMGRENNLSDLCPIFLHFNLSKIKKGRGFWQLNCDFLKEPEFFFGINHTMERVIEQYSDKSYVEAPHNQEPTPKPLPFL